VPKLNTLRLAHAFETRLGQSAARLRDGLARQPTPHVLYFKKTAYNWLTFCLTLPKCFDADDRPTEPTQYDALYFDDAKLRDLAFLLLNGKWLYAYWCAVGDDFHVTRWMFADFPIDLRRLPATTMSRLRPVARELEQVIAKATSFKRNAGKRVGTFNLARCRHVTDRSDRIFAEALGLAEVWDDVELLMKQVVKTELRQSDSDTYNTVDGGTIQSHEGSPTRRRPHEPADLLGSTRTGGTTPARRTASHADRQRTSSTTSKNGQDTGTPSKSRRPARGPRKR
jgi:hypothetical protein